MSDVILSAEHTPIHIEDEMKRSYLDYAMSVIVSRAIPDIRDGLKPVHRRILYAMQESGFDHDKPYKKSARIVGEVMGKYHPHGDSAIYDTLVRMAQDFAMRLPLVDGQGNFGSMDGDKAAAMRYTESRLTKVAHTILDDLDKDTVDFQENYDGSEKEPVVLPSRFPNILVNGAGGIAVGMATNIPTHNLGEVIDACCLLLESPAATIEEIMEVLPGPDFPTGGVILGRRGIHSAMTTGRGSIVMRAKTHVEEVRNGRDAIVVDEIPYQVNKARMIERIAELVREKKVEGIADLRDESSKEGVRVVIEIKRDAMAEVVLNQLYRFTPLQTSFGSNMLVLSYGQPQQMNVRDMLTTFLEFREEVITRRTLFLLKKARDRAHVLIGLAMAVANIDEVIKVIRRAPDPVAAREELMTRTWNAADVSALIALVQDKGNEILDGECRFTEVQARAVLELRLQRLTGLEREKIDGELSELAVHIKDYLDILGSRERVIEIIRNELTEIREAYATPRRTLIDDTEYEHDIEALIQREEMVVTVTMGGYIKRVPLSDYRAQRRGGKGRAGMSVHDEDITTEIFVANTHTPVLFFSDRGMVYKLKTYKLPLGSPQSKGKALVNVLPLEPGETIQTFMALPEDEHLWQELHVMFATAKGNVRRNSLADFCDVRSNGKIAMRMDEDDSLVAVRTCMSEDNVLLCSEKGKAIRFPVAKVRVFKSRTSDGVRGMQLAEKDKVISMTILQDSEATAEERDAYLRYQSATRRGDEGASHELDADKFERMVGQEQWLLTMTVNGFGKRTSSFEYRITNRGGQGVTNIETSDRNGDVVATFPVDDTDQIMLMTDKGKMIRTPVQDIRIAGRATQGVTIFKVSGDERVVSAVRIAESDDDESEGAVEENDDVVATEVAAEAVAEVTAAPAQGDDAS